MDQLLQEFETPIRDREGNLHRVYLYGRGRPGDTWQGWLVFEQAGVRLSTPVETTQPNAEAVLYWASGLTEAYFDGALERARKGATGTGAVAESVPEPLPEPVVGVDHETHRRRLEALEAEILDVFRVHGLTRLRTQTLFDELPHAHADIVRALEGLEKQHGALSRKTEEGNDWIELRS